MKTLFAVCGITAIVIGVMAGFFPQFTFELLAENYTAFKTIIGLGPLLSFACYAAAVAFIGRQVGVIERLLLLAALVLTGMCGAVVLTNVDALLSRVPEDTVSMFSGIAIIAGGMLMIFASVSKVDAPKTLSTING